MNTLNVLTENPATDPALISADALEKSELAGGWHLDAMMDAFAQSVPTTPAGIRRKIDAVCALLATVASGDTLTTDGAAWTRQHLQSTLAAIMRPRQVS